MCLLTNISPHFYTYNLKPIVVIKYSLQTSFYVGHEVVTQELFFSAKTYFEKDHSCRYCKIKWQYFRVRLTMELCSRMRVFSPGPDPLSSKAHPTTVPSEVNDSALVMLTNVFSCSKEAFTHKAEKKSQHGSTSFCSKSLWG